MTAFFGLMIPLTAIMMPVLIVMIVFWYKNEKDARASEVINNGLEQGFSLEEIKELLTYKDKSC